MSRNRGVRRKNEINPRRESPKANLHQIGSLIVQLDIFIVGIVHDWMVHDLIDDDVSNEQRAVPGSRCRALQLLKFRTPTRKATGGNPARVTHERDGGDDL